MTFETKDKLLACGFWSSAAFLIVAVLVTHHQINKLKAQVAQQTNAPIVTKDLLYTGVLEHYTSTLLYTNTAPVIGVEGRSNPIYTNASAQVTPEMSGLIPDFPIYKSIMTPLRLFLEDEFYIGQLSVYYNTNWTITHTNDTHGNVIVFRRKDDK